MITDKLAQDLAGLWKGGESTCIISICKRSLFQGGKSVLYLWEIMQHLQNEYFLPRPYTLSGEQRFQLEALQSYFENEIESYTYIKIEYKKHPVYGYLYADAVSGADTFVDFEYLKMPV